MDFMTVLLGKLTDCCFISTYTPINFLQIGMEAGINIDTEIMIKLNVTLRNITLFGVLKNQGMLNRIFSFMDLGEKKSDHDLPHTFFKTWMLYNSIKYFIVLGKGSNFYGLA